MGCSMTDTVHGTQAQGLFELRLKETNCWLNVIGRKAQTVLYLTHKKLNGQLIDSLCET